jgi:cell division septum initiation protein DivIVA
MVQRPMTWDELCDENERLRSRISELESQLTENPSLNETCGECREKEKRIAELEAALRGTER